MDLDIALASQKNWLGFYFYSSGTCLFFFPHACHKECRRSGDEKGTTWTFKRGEKSLEDVSELCLWDTSCSQPEHGTMSMRIYFDKVYFYSPQGSAWLGMRKKKKKVGVGTDLKSTHPDSKCLWQILNWNPVTVHEWCRIGQCTSHHDNPTQDTVMIHWQKVTMCLLKHWNVCCGDGNVR